MTDDVIARAKRERERYITSGWMDTIRPFNEVIALAESQAAQLSAIRELAENHHTGPIYPHLILAILERTAP